MAATSEQVQAFVDNEIRPICEAIRSVVLKATDIRMRIDDVYANLVDGSAWNST